MNLSIKPTKTHSFVQMLRNAKIMSESDTENIIIAHKNHHHLYFSISFGGRNLFGGRNTPTFPYAWNLEIPF